MFLSSPVSSPRHVFTEVAEGNSSQAQSHKPLSSLHACADQHAPEASDSAQHKVERSCKVTYKGGGFKDGGRMGALNAISPLYPSFMLSGICTFGQEKGKRREAEEIPSGGSTWLKCF